ncbi:MAG: acireductone dioxygenase [Azospirillaceae bacterium]|nr:acireductone dioxygenase [Azospirillaceae bacterium]
MTALGLFAVDRPSQPLRVNRDIAGITDELAKLGVRFEHLSLAAHKVGDRDSPDILETFEPELGELRDRWGYRAADVIDVHTVTDDAATLRATFLREHTHTDDEARFLVRGTSSFFLHISDEVWRLDCEIGDVLAIPAGIPHWFDAGDRPEFTTIRLFTDPAGWIAAYTGDTIASLFAVTGALATLPVPVA